MKKKSRSKSKPRAMAQPPAKRKKWSAGRSRTVRPNGGLPEPMAVAAETDEKVPIGEAMRRAVEALGEVTIDDTLAPQQLRELSACYDEITMRQAAFDAKAEEAKTAKKSLEAATELLLEKVRSFTHAAPLPLFDQNQAEQDHDDMLVGGDAEELGVN